MTYEYCRKCPFCATLRPKGYKESHYCVYGPILQENIAEIRSCPKDEDEGLKSE